jgi:hypothetical protein
MTCKAFGASYLYWVDFKNTDLGEQLYLSIDNVGLSITKFWLGYKLECPTQNHNIKCTLFKGLSLSKPKLKFVNFDIMIQHPTMLEWKFGRSYPKKRGKLPNWANQLRKKNDILTKEFKKVAKLQ